MSQVLSQSPRVSQTRQRVTEITITSSAFKFCIALFASVCAVFLPKLVVYLKHEGGDSLDILNLDYIVAGGLFALLVAGVILIFGWKKPDTPRNVFMTALGIPALLSGTLNAIGSADNLKLQADQQRLLLRSVANIANVQISSTPITLPESTPAADKQSFLFDIVSSAVAAEVPANALAQSKFGTQVIQQQYVVVIDQLPTRALADARAQMIRPKFPNAAVVPAGGTFYVTTSARALSQVDALSDASRVQQNGQRATLVPVKR